MEQQLNDLSVGSRANTCIEQELIEWSREQGLSRAESAVFYNMFEGGSTRDIAAKLFISTATVRTHVEAILRKLAVSTRLQAVVRARKGIYGA